MSNDADSDAPPPRHDLRDNSAGARSVSGDESASTLEVAASPRVILVDGFNVLHAVLLGKERTTGWWRREHRERLLERICDWRGGPDQIWVAFDGPHPDESVWAEPVASIESGERSAATIHSVFVESADDWIVRRARRSEDPARTLVVSADRKVAGRARSAGCEILTPWTFMASCGPEAVTQDGAS